MANSLLVSNSPVNVSSVTWFVGRESCSKNLSRFIIPGIQIETCLRTYIYCVIKFTFGNYLNLSTINLTNVVDESCEICCVFSFLLIFFFFFSCLTFFSRTFSILFLLNFVRTIYRLAFRIKSIIYFSLSSSVRIRR